MQIEIIYKKKSQSEKDRAHYRLVLKEGDFEMTDIDIRELDFEKCESFTVDEKKGGTKKSKKRESSFLEGEVTLIALIC